MSSRDCGTILKWVLGAGFALVAIVVSARASDGSVRRISVGSQESQTQALNVPPQSIASGLHVPIASFAPEKGVSGKIPQFVDGVADSMGVCACGIGADSRDANVRPIGQTSYKGVNGTRFAMSVVNYQFALKMFQYISSRRQIPFTASLDGCYARAHEMAYLLEKKGVLVGKIMVRGDFRLKDDRAPRGFVAWRFHVAPVVTVDDGTSRALWVLDPSLFNEPVPLESWLSVLASHPRSVIRDIMLTSRFYYHPDRLAKAHTDWDDEELRDARRLDRRFYRIAHMAEKPGIMMTELKGLSLPDSGK